MTRLSLIRQSNCNCSCGCGVALFMNEREGLFVCADCGPHNRKVKDGEGKNNKPRAA
jgi:Zn finger protein HypA/HybF involved in hydrogenase expression